MKGFFTILFSLAMIHGWAQSGAPFEQSPTLPVFDLMRPDSSVFNKKSFKAMPTMLMFFSPGCPHCVHQIDSMLVYKNGFKNIQIVMATYQPIEELAAFEAKQVMSEFNYVLMGRDINFFMPVHYQIRTLPFMVLYDRNGKLIKSYHGNTPVKEILQAFSIRK